MYIINSDKIEILEHDHKSTPQEMILYKKNLEKKNQYIPHIGIQLRHG